MSRAFVLPVVAAVSFFASIGSASAQNPPNVETIDVIGTPLGSKLDAEHVAANVQSATAEELRGQGALDLADFMKRSLASVFVNDAQSNPLQPDVQYRGFTGSPLLGLPQGLAIYQDGVRLNEPFGDTVNWALIPESAIDTVYLLPGSNPLFGLNALGGAIAIETKNGFTNAGTRGELVGGSFGRTSVQAETGGTFGDGLGYFVTASHLDEDGWRDYSPTKANQLFATLGMHDDDTSVDVGLTYADTNLVGNGAAPGDLLAIDRRAVFTHPDETRSHLALLNATAEQHVSAAVTLTGNLYVRDSRSRTLNGDDSDYAACAAAPAFICDGGGTLALDANGAAIASAPGLEGATVNRTETDQSTTGFSFQALVATSRGRRDNQLTVGVAHDGSHVDFAASSELGSLDATRRAVPGGVFVGDAFTDLTATIQNTGLYFTDTLSFGERTALTLSGRYNESSIVLEDQLGDELSGNHTFTHFNPGVGVTTRLRDALTFYASTSRANRAPSPVELTCADQNDPCRLPNAFVADPPLKQVVATTFETGLRGRFRNGQWHASVFRTINDDDILFISAGALTNEGYFANVGKTRRDGLELNLSGAAGARVTWSLDYTHLDATFRQSFLVASPNHPAQVGGEISVAVGDRLPLIPQRLWKAGLKLVATKSLTLGADLQSAAGIYYRGDEANLLAPLPGYSVLNLRAEYRLSQRMSLFAKLDNALDERYSTFGVLGDAGGVLGTAFADPRFLGPGAPRAAWIAIRLEL
jgi:iron complex outermembrane receptor protein